VTAVEHTPTGAPDAQAAGGDRWATAAPLALVALFSGVVLYATFGKGFAYAGWPPVFVGEALLVVVVVAALRRGLVFPRNVLAAVTAFVAAVALVQVALERTHASVPLQETIRGVAPIYYSAYAFAAFSLLRGYERGVGAASVVATIDRGMTRALPYMVAALAAIASLAFIDPALPTWPGSGAQLFAKKGADLAVGLVIVLPFVMARRDVTRRVLPSWALPAVWWFSVLVATRSRGALFAIIVGALVVRPNVARWLRVGLVIATIVLVLYVSGVTITMQRREVSYDAATDAVASVVGGKEEDEIGGGYVGTAEWRAKWWSDIWDDVTGQDMLLAGYGWGDNLAVRYGVVPSSAADDPRVLRLPHNIFFSLAGRAGLVLAVAFIAVPVFTIARTFRGGGSTSLPVQAARGALAATLAAGLVDVHLESPQGGILLWTLTGFLWWATAARLPEPRAVRPPATVG
jgi:O-Antigen ligase